MIFSLHKHWDLSNVVNVNCGNKNLADIHVPVRWYSTCLNWGSSRGNSVSVLRLFLHSSSAPPFFSQHSSTPTPNSSLFSEGLFYLAPQRSKKFFWQSFNATACFLSFLTLQFPQCWDTSWSVTWRHNYLRLWCNVYSYLNPISRRASPRLHVRLYYVAVVMFTMASVVLILVMWWVLYHLSPMFSYITTSCQKWNTSTEQ